MQSSRIFLLWRYALFTLLLVPPAAAEPPPPLQWIRGDTLQITWPQQVKAQVLNRLSTQQNVRVELVEVDSGARQTVRSLLKIDPTSSVPIDPGRAGTFTIAAQSSIKADPGTYEGVLVAYSENPESSIRRDVRLTVPPTISSVSERSIIKLLVPELQLRTYRCPRLGCLCQCPCWGDPLDDARIPANIGKGESWIAPKVYLATADGATAELSLKQPDSSAAGVHGLKVKVDKTDRVGKYSGKLPSGTSNEGDAVNVTLTVAHPPLFAVLAVCAGILLALWIQRYTGVLRLTWALAAREAEIGSNFEAAQNVFGTKAAGQPYAGYSLSDLDTRRAALRGKIAALQKSVFTSLDTTNPKYLEIDAELKALEAVPEQWEEFAAKLSDLNEALGRTVWGKASAYLAQAPTPDRPAIRKKIDQILTGSSITVQEFGKLVNEVPKGPDFLAAWEGLNSRAALLHEMLASLKEKVKAADATTQQRTQPLLEQAEAALAPIWNRLWSHTDVDPSAQTGLDTIESQLAVARTLLSETRKLRGAFDSAPASPPAHPDFAAILGRLAAAPVRQPVSDTERLRLLHQRQRVAAWAVALLGFLLALYTGMKQLYIGQAFGYWLDYVEIIAWAVAAQSALEMIVRGLDRIWGLGGLFRGRTIGAP